MLWHHSQRFKKVALCALLVLSSAAFACDETDLDPSAAKAPKTELIQRLEQVKRYLREAGRLTPEIREALRRFLDEQAANVDQLSFKEVRFTWKLLDSARIHNHQFLSALAKHSVALLAEISFEEKVIFATELIPVRAPKASLVLKPCLDEISERFGELSHVNVASLMRLFGKENLLHSQFIRQVESLSEEELADYGLQNLTYFLTTLATLNQRSSPAIPRITEVFLAGSEAVRQDDLARVARALSILGYENAKDLTELDGLIARLDPKQVGPKLATSLYRSARLFENIGIKLSLPGSIFKEGHFQLAFAGGLNRSNKMEREVAQLLSELGIHFEREAFVESFHWADIVIHDQKLIIEVDGEFHFLRNFNSRGQLDTNLRVGKNHALDRFLHEKGWTVRRIDFRQWRHLKRSKRKRLLRRIKHRPPRK